MRAGTSTMAARWCSTYTKSGVTLQIIARSYNDGVAFRYRILGSGGVTITAENTGFRLPVTTGGWAAVWNGNYEQDYLYRNAATLNGGTDYTMPLLASINNNAYYALISEANVYNSGASYAPAMLDGDGLGTGLLRLTRTPDQGFPMSATLPFQTPWRVVIVAPNLDVLYNTDLIQHLNPPAASTPSWVKPGRAAWSWYTDEDSASDLNKQKQLVDFAASMGFEYITVDCCYTSATDLPAISAYAAQPEREGVRLGDRSAVRDPGSSRRPDGHPCRVRRRGSEGRLLPERLADRAAVVPIDRGCGRHPPPDARPPRQHQAGR